MVKKELAKDPSWATPFNFLAMEEAKPVSDLLSEKGEFPKNNMEVTPSSTTFSNLEETIG